MCRDLCPDGWIWEKRLRLIPKTSRGAEGHFGLVWVVGPLPYIPLGRIAVSHPRVSWGNFRIYQVFDGGTPYVSGFVPGWVDMGETAKAHTHDVSRGLGVFWVGMGGRPIAIYPPEPYSRFSS